MNVTFQDMQDENNELNSTTISDAEALRALFISLKGRQPFGFLLIGDNGITLTIGYSDECGTVQYGSSEGLPPYLMAVANGAVDDRGFVEFLAGGTPTPISRRFCLPIERVEEIAAHFLARGSKSEAVTWEKI